MNMFILVVLMIVNTLISIWNAYACGRYWTESKLIGGWTRVITWCGVVMSAVGFSWVLLVLLISLALSLHWLEPVYGKVAFEIGYLVLIIPLLVSGLGIWLHSLIMAYRKRSFGNMAVAGWNTFAQFHNTWEAASETPGIIKHIASVVSDSDVDSDSAWVIVVLLVLAALALGILTTAMIVRWADKKVAIEIVRAR